MGRVLDPKLLLKPFEALSKPFEALQALGRSFVLDPAFLWTCCDCNKEETNPGASGQVQDHQEHHRDDQEQLLDNFLAFFCYEVLRRFKRLNNVLFFVA